MSHSPFLEDVTTANTAGPIVVTAHVKGVVARVAFQPSLTREGRHSVACPSEVLPVVPLAGSSPLPFHLPLHRPPQLRGPLLCAPRHPPTLPKALVTSLEWVALGSQESRAKPPSPPQPRNLLGQPTPHAPWLLEHLDQTQQRLLFQMTLQTAGEGDRKSPQRVQKMRHVQRKGLEGLGGDDTGWTSWSETLKLNVPIHFGNHGRLVVPGKLLTLKLKLS